MTERAQNYDTGLMLPSRLTYLLLMWSYAGKCAVSVDLSIVGKWKDARFVGDRPTDLDSLDIIGSISSEWQVVKSKQSKFQINLLQLILLSSFVSVWSVC